QGQVIVVVVRFSGDQNVIALAGNDHVGTHTADEQISAMAAYQDVVAHAADQDVIAAAAHQDGAVVAGVQFRCQVDVASNRQDIAGLTDQNDAADCLAVLAVGEGLMELGDAGRPVFDFHDQLVGAFVIFNLNGVVVGAATDHQGQGGRSGNGACLHQL